MIDPAEFEAVTAAASELALGAGAILSRHFGSIEEGEIDFKGKRDLQTRADRESEAFLVEEIRKRFPEHLILAEESHRGSGRALVETGRPVWIIDPLDGTTNFVHRLPSFAVSIGVVDADGPLVGAIHAPRLDEHFLAARGRGASLNGRPIRVSPCPDLISALLATGFAYAIDTLEDDNLDHFARLVKKTRGIRRFGSAALDLAWTAAGRFDGFWELHLSPWDVAAGALVVREAGGVVTDLEGGDDWLFGGHLVAAGPRLHPAIRSELRPR